MPLLPCVALLFAAAAPAADPAREPLAAAFGPGAETVAALAYRLQVEDGAGLPASDARYMLWPVQARLYREEAESRTWSDATSAWRLTRGQWETLDDAGLAPLRGHVAYNFIALLHDPAARIERVSASRLRLQPGGQEAFEVELDGEGRPLRNLFADGVEVRELDWRAAERGLQWPMRYEVLDRNGAVARVGRFSDFRSSSEATLPSMPMEATERTLAEAEPGSVRLVGAGWLSGPRNDYNLSTDASGQLLVFARSDADFRHARIHVSRRAGGVWSEPAEAPFTDAHYSDSDPWLTPDGRTLYFTSNRPVQGEAASAGLDLWRVSVTADGFGTPEPLQALHAEGMELGPELHGGWLYFNSTRPGGPAPLSIWRARVEGDGFGVPEPLPATINFGRQQGDFTMSPDERVALFWSDGGDGDAGDLFAVRREGDRWARPVRLPAPINGAAFEFTPSFSPDGRQLRFSSMRKPAWLDDARHVFNGQSNVYTATVDLEAWLRSEDSGAAAAR